MNTITPPTERSDTSAHPVKRTPFNRRISFWLIILLIILIIGLGWQHYASRRNARKQLIPVVLATVQTHDVPVYLTALGTVTPTYNVTVRTQINGQLLHVLFTEGQLVKTGDLLAEIDARPYQAQLTQYQGQLERDRALLANAQIDLQRYKALIGKSYVTQQTLATQASLVDQYEGAVKVDQGLIQAAQVNLTYTKITSPIDGRIGLRLVDAGNIVQTSDANGIAVVNTLDPITVIFTLPEDDIDQVMTVMTANKPLAVETYDRQQNKLLATGQLLTMDNQIDTTTGTVKLKAQFNNKDNRLYPSQFVNVKLLVTTIQNAIVVPTAAIQYSSMGTFVYRLNNDHTVSSVAIDVGKTTGDETVVVKGLQPGQLVVVEGADKLLNGMKVAIPNSVHLRPIKTASRFRGWTFFRRWFA